jgi:hypothetical protein
MAKKDGGASLRPRGDRAWSHARRAITRDRTRPNKAGFRDLQSGNTAFRLTGGMDARRGPSRRTATVNEISPPDPGQVLLRASPGFSRFHASLGRAGGYRTDSVGLIETKPDAIIEIVGERGRKDERFARDRGHALARRRRKMINRLHRAAGWKRSPLTLGYRHSKQDLDGVNPIKRG